jgi:hypothetical protein
MSQSNDVRVLSPTSTSVFPSQTMWPSPLEHLSGCQATLAAVDSRLSPIRHRCGLQVSSSWPPCFHGCPAHTVPSCHTHEAPSTGCHVPLFAVAPIQRRRDILPVPINMASDRSSSLLPDDLALPRPPGSLSFDRLTRLSCATHRQTREWRPHPDNLFPGVASLTDS